MTSHVANVIFLMIQGISSQSDWSLMPHKDLMRASIYPLAYMYTNTYYYTDMELNKDIDIIALYYNNWHESLTIIYIY